MSNAKDKTYNTIEYYKSELIKKDEMIEKLLEEVGRMKVEQQEQNEIFKKLQNKESTWKSREKEIENQLKELRNLYQELNSINYKLKIENENLKIERLEEDNHGRFLRYERFLRQQLQ
jgi:hypothetical protein